MTTDNPSRRPIEEFESSEYLAQIEEVIQKMAETLEVFGQSMALLALTVHKMQDLAERKADHGGD